MGGLTTLSFSYDKNNLILDHDTFPFCFHLPSRLCARDCVYSNSKYFTTDQAVQFSEPTSQPPLHRGYEASGATFVPPGSVQMPNSRYSRAARPPLPIVAHHQRVLHVHGLQDLNISADILDDLLQDVGGNVSGSGGGDKEGGGEGGGGQYTSHVQHGRSPRSNTVGASSAVNASTDSTLLINTIAANTSSSSSSSRAWRSPERNSEMSGASVGNNIPDATSDLQNASNNSVSWMHSSGMPISGSNRFPATSSPSTGWQSGNGGSGGGGSSRRCNISHPQATSPPVSPPPSSRYASGSGSAGSVSKEHAKFLAQAIAALIPLVEQYHHRPGLPVSFDFQEKVLDALTAELVEPLSKHHAETTSILQGDAHSAKASLADSSAELVALRRAEQRLDDQIRTLIAAPLGTLGAAGAGASASLATSSSKSGGAGKLAVNEVRGAGSDGGGSDGAGDGSSDGGGGGGSLATDLQSYLKMLNRELGSSRRKLAQTEAEAIRLRHTEGTYLAEIKTLHEQVDAFSKASEDTRKIYTENEELKNKCKAVEQQMATEREVHADAQEARLGSHAAADAAATTVPQLKALTAMLQESHSSLAATNEHLLRQLEAERYTHTQELEQLRWNYDELKRTADLLA